MERRCLISTYPTAGANCINSRPSNDADMEKSKHSRYGIPVITQAQNNTTLWVGQLYNDPTDHLAGQTFYCTTEGVLDNIQVFSEAVQKPGDLELTLHEFEEGKRNWALPIGQAALQVKKLDHAKWIQFAMPNLPLHAGKIYGFRLKAVNALIGLGEAATGNQQPFEGQEWHSDSMNGEGHFFSYFSLAFKVELCT